MEYLLSLPPVVSTAAFGAIGGGVGAGFGVLLKKFGASSKIAMIVQIVCIVIAIQIPMQAGRNHSQEDTLNQVMTELKQMRLYSVLFKVHPEAETEMRSKLGDLMKTATKEDAYMRAQATSAELVSRYFQKHLLNASDSSIFALLTHNVQTMKVFQNTKPELCVNYYLGAPKFGKDDLDKGLIEQESNLKADIIESSVNSPSPAPAATKVEALTGVIAGAYKQKGFPLDDLEKLGRVNMLPAPEGCKVATEFSEALASLGTQQASHIFKGLIQLSGVQ